MQTEYIFAGHVPFVLVNLLFWIYRISFLQSDVQSRMKVTEKDVAYVAELANLELTDEERVRMLRDLNSILEHIDALNEVDTAGVQPMAQVSDRYGVDNRKTGSERFAYASREDIHEGLRKSLLHDVALQNAPDSDGIYFTVPKVIER